jgi:hypothetical protein
VINVVLDASALIAFHTEVHHSLTALQIPDAHECGRRAEVVPPRATVF